MASGAWAVNERELVNTGCKGNLFYDSSMF